MASAAADAGDRHEPDVSQPFATLLSQLLNPALQVPIAHRPLTHWAAALGNTHCSWQPPQLLTSVAVFVSQPFEPFASQLAINVGAHEVIVHVPLTHATVLFGAPWQSSWARHELPTAHRLGQAPPQSMSPSRPFLIPSVHDGGGGGNSQLGPEKPVLHTQKPFVKVPFPEHNVGPPAQRPLTHA